MRVKKNKNFFFKVDGLTRRFVFSFNIYKEQEYGFGLCRRQNTTPPASMSKNRGAMGKMWVSKSTIYALTHGKRGKSYKFAPRNLIARHYSE